MLGNTFIYGVQDDKPQIVLAISYSDDETNTLLNNEWFLLYVCNHMGRPLFVLGLPYTFDIDAYCQKAVSVEM